MLLLISFAGGDYVIEQIKNIGHEVRIIDGEKDLVELWTKNAKPMDNVIFVNVDEGEKKSLRS